MASCILASARSCSPDFALRFFNAIASARVLYAVPLVALRPAQWDALDTLHHEGIRALHCGVVRRLYGLPRSSPIGPTLAEAGETSLSLRARGSALRHIPRMLPIPPHQDPSLDITTTIPGIRSKGNTLQSALHQEALAMIEERLASRVLLYTDGSVAAGGSAAAACFASSLGLGEKCRLPISASSTAAELAVIDLAANQLAADFLPQSAAMVCDSRAALLTLARGQRGAPRCATARAEVRSDCAEKPPTNAAEDRHQKAARAFLLRLRTDFSRTAGRRFDFTNSGSPSCAECLAVETTEHILLQYPGYTEQRRRLFDAYGRLGLLHALFEFFGDADLIVRL
ncbi:hypothetical protein MRX96_037543 [Rhipicephalus microplus]